MPLEMNREVFITCPVTGSGGTQDRSPHVPRSPEEIADSAVEAAKAGAAIVHCHVRDPETGAPSRKVEYYREVTERIRESDTDVVINLTTGGSPYMTMEARVKPAAIFKPEIASLNMGSMNLGLFRMLKRHTEFKYDWEPAMLEGSHDLVFRNSYKDIRYALDTLNETGTRYEFECYDTAHLHNLNYFFQEGLVTAPLFIQTCFGLLGGIGVHPEEVLLSCTEK